MTDLTRAKSFVEDLPLMDMAPDELAHYGVLGMKWGVRKDRGHEGEQAKTKDIKKLDRKFERGARSSHTKAEFHNFAAQKMNTIDLNKINSKPEYRNGIPDGNKALRDKYENEVQETYLRRLADAAKEAGTNASGTREYIIVATQDGRWGVTTREVRHASDDSSDIVYLTIKRNSKNLIISITPDVSELAHYGVLGMKWGRRKPESIARDQRAERYARNTRRKLAVGTLGGSIIAAKVATNVRKNRAEAKARESVDHKEARELLRKRTPELSNKDIDRIIARLQKEQNLGRLNPTSIQRGKKIVVGVIAAAGTAAGVYNLVKSPAGQAAIKRGSSIVSGFLQGSGKHVLRETVKTARHLA
jgi:hypothetical protein